MMRISILALATLLGFMSSGCNKIEGCTDPSSLTYNQDATLDDGSCLYTSDTYVGNYTVNDTLANADTTYVRTYGFNITKVHRGAVTLNNFHAGLCSPQADVTMTAMELPEGRPTCGITNFIGSFDDGVLRFTYVVDTINPINVSGTALWQN